MNINYSSVKVLMCASGQEPGDATSKLYTKLINEEFEEFCLAEEAHEEFDACLDLIWVTIGYMLSKGWPIEEGWQEIERSNLDKIDPETLHVIRRHDGKILKPAGWIGPRLEELLNASD